MSAVCFWVSACRPQVGLQRLGLDGFVGGYEADAFGQEPLEVGGLVDGPHVGDETELLGLLDPCGVGAPHLVLVVDARVAGLLGLLGREVAVEIAHLDALGGVGHEVVAGVLDKRDILHAVGQMGLGHLSEDGVHAAVLIALLGVLLHLEDEARVAQRLGGGEIGREGGQRLTMDLETDDGAAHT